jgi:hypothetical protein
MINQFEPSVMSVTLASCVERLNVEAPSIVSEPFGSIVMALVLLFLIWYLKPDVQVAAATKLTVIGVDGV